MHYCRWLSLRSGRLITLPHEIHWEKAGRGVAGCLYPWGTAMDPALCNIYNSHESGMRPVAVSAFPSDESVYGVRGMAGNAREFCVNPLPAGYGAWRAIRGASWADEEAAVRMSARTDMHTYETNFDVGARVVLIPRLPHVR